MIALLILWWYASIQAEARANVAFADACDAGVAEYCVSNPIYLRATP